jgi:hypothetical protein
MIVQRKVCSIGNNGLAQALGHRQKQLWKIVMADHQVCHREQSFVTAKVPFRLEMTVCTQFATSPLTNRGEVQQRLFLSPVVNFPKGAD